MRKKAIFILFFILVVFSFLSLNFKKEKIIPAPTISSVNKTVSYNGEVGKDALTILKQKYSVSQDNSGLVNVIGGRKADVAKHEYWAFYVNGKMANVGPADYETKDEDLIEWKIENY